MAESWSLRLGSITLSLTCIRFKKELCVGQQLYYLKYLVASKQGINRTTLHLGSSSHIFPPLFIRSSSSPLYLFSAASSAISQTSTQLPLHHSLSYPVSPLNLSTSSCSYFELRVFDPIISLSAMPKHQRTHVHWGSTFKGMIVDIL